MLDRGPVKKKNRNLCINLGDGAMAQATQHLICHGSLGLEQGAGCCTATGIWRILDWLLGDSAAGAADLKSVMARVQLCKGHAHLPGAPRM